MYRCKIALVRNNFNEMLQIVKMSILALSGDRAASHAGEEHPILSGRSNLDVALEIARAIAQPETWNRLAAVDETAVVAREDLKRQHTELIPQLEAADMHSALHSYPAARGLDRH